MYNWSTNLQFLKKHPQQYTIWKLEQLVNFGLGNEKIKKEALKKHFLEIDIDPDKRKYLQFLLEK